jgi:hypothetical protein
MTVPAFNPVLHLHLHVDDKQCFYNVGVNDRPRASNINRLGEQKAQVARERQ